MNCSAYTGALHAAEYALYSIQLVVKQQCSAHMVLPVQHQKSVVLILPQGT
jgi:hypothetical protein